VSYIGKLWEMQRSLKGTEDEIVSSALISMILVTLLAEWVTKVSVIEENKALTSNNIERSLTNFQARLISKKQTDVAFCYKRKRRIKEQKKS
jgi:hypothetical protein